MSDPNQAQEPQQAAPEGEKLDPISAYNKAVEEAMKAPLADDYVDPHFGAKPQQSPDYDVTGKANDNRDVDPERFGPTEAELRAGMEEGGGGGLPTEEGGTQGLPTEEGDKTQQQPTQAKQPAVDAVALAAAALRAANPALSIADALAIAEARAPKAAEQTQTTAAQVEAQEIVAPDVPTPEELRAKRKELDKEWRNAVKDLADDDAIEAIEKQIEELDDQIPQAEQAHVEYANQVRGQFEQFANKTVEHYPDAAVEGSPLFNRMEEIHRTMEETGDETLNSPRKALLIAQMAARELGIAPRTVKPAATTQQGKPAAPRVKGNAPMTAPLASGSARTASPPINVVDKAIAGIRTPEDFANTMRGLGIRV